MEWKPISTAPRGVAVMTKIDDKDGVRNEQPLVLDRNLWWFTDHSMYVYYNPTNWADMHEAGR